MVNVNVAVDVFPKHLTYQNLAAGMEKKTVKFHLGNYKTTYKKEMPIICLAVVKSPFLKLETKLVNTAT